MTPCLASTCLKVNDSENRSKASGQSCSAKEIDNQGRETGSYPLFFEPFLNRDHHHGTGCVADNSLSHTAHENVLKPTSSVRAYHNEVNILFLCL